MHKYLHPDFSYILNTRSCGNVYPIFQTYPESEIKDSLQTVNNPFEESASIFLSVGKRKFKKNRLDKYLEDQDPDISKEQRRVGSENVRIIQ